METNPWNLEGANIPYAQPTNSTLPNQFNGRDALFVQRFPLLCSVPNADLFATAMQGYNGAVDNTQLGEEIMTLANSYIQLDAQFSKHKNEYDVLLEKNLELSETVAKLQKKKVVSTTASSQLQQQNSVLQQQVQHLEQQIASSSQLQQQHALLQQKNQELQQQALNFAQGTTHSSQRSAEYPDPEVFSAESSESRKELPLFIRKVNMKFISNADWYPSEQSKMSYIVSRLKGKAYSTIAHSIKRDGTINLSSSDAMLTLLEQAFADVDECNTARRQILVTKQGQKETSNHISDWLEIAHKTDLSDDALINHFYDSLHPLIVSQIQNRLMIRQEMPADLCSYLVEVRHIDAVLRSSNPNYTKNKPSFTSSFQALRPMNAQYHAAGGDPMDLSASKASTHITWTTRDATNHRIPRNEAEKLAKRDYCFENNLCSWCYDPGHRARVCAEARWNQGKKKSRDNKTVIEEEKV